MTSAVTGLPDSLTLHVALTAVFANSPDARGEPIVVERHPNIYVSTFPSEIVTCRLLDGTEVEVLCKYAGRQDETVEEHKGGGAYEARVYRRILQSVSVPKPKLYGTYEEHQRTWLVLEYFGRSGRDVRLKHQPRIERVKTSRMMAR